MTNALSSGRRRGTAIERLLPALVTTAIGTRGLFAVTCGARPQKVMTNFFGSRFDGPSGTVFGLLFAGADAALGYGTHWSRNSPTQLARWLWVGAGVDLVHSVLAATNRDATPGRRRATTAMIGSLAVAGAVMARAAAKADDPCSPLSRSTVQ